MQFLRSLFRRLNETFRRDALERDLADQMQEHVELMVEENVAQGMNPEEARQAARRKFGNVGRIQEQARDEWGWSWLEHAWKDLQFGFRQLVRSPGFTLIAVLSIGVAIGANTAIFSLLDELVLKPLPVRHPDELVQLSWVSGAKGSWVRWSGGNFSANDRDPATGREMNRNFSGPTYDAFRRTPVQFAELFGMAVLFGPNITIDGTTETLHEGQLVSGDAFRVLGVDAILGRILTPEDDEPAAPPVMVISFSYWQERFGGDPAVIGKVVSVNRVPLTIVGVTPASYRGLAPTAGPAGTDFTAPLVLIGALSGQSDAMRQPGRAWLSIMGRLKPGATMTQLRDSLEATFLASIKGTLSKFSDLPHLGVAAGGTGRTEADRKSILPFIIVMLGMVGLLLLATCANVGNLLLARGAARRREIAVRLALGASRGRVVRQLLIENLVLAVFAGALGLLFSRWGLSLLAMLLSPEERPALTNVSLDYRVLAFTAAVALGTNLILGLAPALRATRIDLTTEFQGGPRSLGIGSRSRLSKFLLMTQVAVAFVLLVSAGLFIRTVSNLRAVDLGFNRTNLLLFAVDFTPGNYQPAQYAAIHADFAARLAALPGVQSATWSLWPLVSGYGGYQGDFSLPGRAAPPDKPEVMTYNQVGPDFFRTFNIPFLQGEDFGAAGSAATPKVAVVNRAFARKYFGEDSPVGKFLNLGGERQIVGVVGDVKQSNLRAPSVPTVFIPDSQGINQPGEVHWAVRTSADPVTIAAAIRKALNDFDHNLPLRMMRTQEEEVDRRIEGERMFSTIAGFVGLLSLALACIGLYGLMSFIVVRRTAEIGLRMALGALPWQVQRGILRESLIWVTAGLALGVAIAAVLVRAIRSLLFEVSPMDPVTFSGAGLLLATVAVFACWWPARRASRINPIEALRSE